jgi:hypothetical protein
VRKVSLILSTALLAVAIIAVPAASAAKHPCAKQVTALKKARTKAAKTKAKRKLATCRREHAPVVVSPANPFVDEAVTITIHPSSPLPEGQVYTYYVHASGGSFDDGFSHFVFKETTSTSVTIEAGEDLTGGKEWADGKGSALVSRGLPNAEEGTPIGAVLFRFIQKP